MTQNKKRLKNWAAALDEHEYIAQAMEELRAAGARKVSARRHTKAGPVVGLTFEILDLEMDSQIYAFRIVPEVATVTARVMESAMYASLTPHLEAQVRRTMWANVRDYIRSALALAQSGGHSLVQVFFPFLVSEQDENKTLFEVFREQLALPMAGASEASPVMVIEEVEVL